MATLFKEQNGDLHYWECWFEGKVRIIHEGIVGDIGTTEKTKIGFFKSAKANYDELVEEKLEQGYAEQDEDDLTELVVQHPYAEGEMEDALLRRQFLEEVLEDLLHTTLLGEFDGGDVGSGTTNIFLFVNDVERATKAILQTLEEDEHTRDVRIAYLDKNDDYISLYPAGADFEIF